MKNKKSSKTLPVKKKKFAWYVFLLVLIPVILNWKTLNYDFTTCDDTVIIRQNIDFLKNLSNIPEAFHRDNFLSKNGESYYRPVQTISFIIDSQFDSESTKAFHFFNLLYHVLTVIILYHLLKLLGIKNIAAFWTALLFSVHPLFTNAIVWIPGRGDILAGLFGSLSFLLFIKYINTKNLKFLVLNLTVFLLAVFSKEISILLPLVMLSYLWIIKKKNYIKDLYVWGAVSGAVILLFVFLRNSVMNPKLSPTIGAFINNLPTIPTLLAKLFLPFGLSPNPEFNIIYTLLGCVFASVIIFYLLKNKNEINKYILFGLLWFVIFTLPAMMIMQPLGKHAFDYLECRTYFPAIGFFIAFGIWLHEITNPVLEKSIPNYIIPVVIFFAAISFIDSGDYSNPVNFYTSVINSNPSNVTALSARGTIYVKDNNPSAALKDYDNAIKILPNYGEAYYNKGDLFFAIGNFQLAEEFMSQALNMDTLYPSVNKMDSNDHIYLNLSTIKLNLQKYDEAETLLLKVMKKDPDNCSIHNNLGLAYYFKGDYKKAVSEFDKAISIDSGSPSYWNNRGKAKFEQKDFQNALSDFNSSLSIRPQFPEALHYKELVKKELSSEK